MTSDVGEARTSTPARTLKEQARRQIPSWHWLKVFLEEQRIELEPFAEAATSGKKQIARDADLRQLTAQVLGTIPGLQGGLRDVLLRKRLDCLLLGAEFIPQQGYRADDIAAILAEFTKQQTLPRDDARWPSARLIWLPASCEALGMDVEGEPSSREIRERPTTVSPRDGLGLEGEEANWSSDLAVPRESFDAASHFTRSTETIREARRFFQEELTALTGRTLSGEQLKEIVSLVERQCESLFLVLREPSGQVVTLRFDEANGQAETIPLHGSETVIRCASLPAFEVIPIEGLPDRERAILFGRREGHFLSRLRAESMSEEERQQIARQAAKALNRQMTPEQRRERGSKGARKLNENSTAEERSERARRAVQARWARKRGETNQ